MALAGSHVGVHVDDAGHHQAPLGIVRYSGRAAAGQPLAHRRDFALGNAHVADTVQTVGWVHHTAVFNDEVQHRTLLL